MFTGHSTHPMVERPVNIDALNRKEFYAVVVSLLKHSLQNNNNPVISKSSSK